MQSLEHLVDPGGRLLSFGFEHVEVGHQLKHRRAGLGVDGLTGQVRSSRQIEKPLSHAGQRRIGLVLHGLGFEAGGFQRLLYLQLTGQIFAVTLQALFIGRPLGGREVDHLLCSEDLYILELVKLRHGGHTLALQLGKEGA
ncbi:hypothetical protein D3C77_517000 [compost metagenome]